MNFLKGNCVVYPVRYVLTEHQYRYKIYQWLAGFKINWIME
jgi:hypothetical protein